VAVQNIWKRVFAIAAVLTDPPEAHYRPCKYWIRTILANCAWGWSVRTIVECTRKKNRHCHPYAKNDPTVLKFFYNLLSFLWGNQIWMVMISSLSRTLNIINTLTLNIRQLITNLQIAGEDHKKTNWIVPSPNHIISYISGWCPIKNHLYASRYVKISISLILSMGENARFGGKPICL
jgi:hypothetical protein